MINSVSHIPERHSGCGTAKKLATERTDSMPSQQIFSLSQLAEVSPTGAVESDGRFQVRMCPLRKRKSQLAEQVRRRNEPKGGADAFAHSLDLPDLQLVTIASLVNSSQHNGSESTTFVNTGGRIAVFALGSTACGPVKPSSPSPVEIAELDRTLLAEVPCVSARVSCDVVNLEAMEPRWRTDAAPAPPPPLGRCSMPTLKSQRHSRRSSPTLPKR